MRESPIPMMLARGERRTLSVQPKAVGEREREFASLKFLFSQSEMERGESVRFVDSPITPTFRDDPLLVSDLELLEQRRLLLLSSEVGFLQSVWVVALQTTSSGRREALPSDSIVQSVGFVDVSFEREDRSIDEDSRKAEGIRKVGFEG